MAFFRQLLSKVTIAIAAGAAEQSVRHAVSEAWTKHKQAKGEATDATLGGDKVPTMNPLVQLASRFKGMLTPKASEEQAAKAYLAAQKAEAEAGSESDPEES